MNKTEYCVGLASALNDIDELKQLSLSLFGKEITFKAQVDPAIITELPAGHIYCYNSREESGEVILLPVIEVLTERKATDQSIDVETIGTVNVEKSRIEADKYMEVLLKHTREIVQLGVDAGMKPGKIQSVGVMTAMPEAQDYDIMSWIELTVNIKHCKLGA